MIRNIVQRGTCIFTEVYGLYVGFFAAKRSFLHSLRGTQQRKVRNSFLVLNRMTVL